MSFRDGLRDVLAWVPEPYSRCMAFLAPLSLEDRLMEVNPHIVATGLRGNDCGIYAIQVDRIRGSDEQENRLFGYAAPFEGIVVATQGGAASPPVATASTWARGMLSYAPNMPLSEVLAALRASGPTAVLAAVYREVSTGDEIDVLYWHAQRVRARHPRRDVPGALDGGPRANV